MGRGPRLTRRAPGSEGAAGRWRRLPAYPVLLAVFPVLNLAAHNAGELPLFDWVVPLLLTLGCTLGLLAALALVLRSRAEAGFVAAVLVVALGYYGHITEGLPSLALGVPAVHSDAGFLLGFEVIRLAPPHFVWIGDRAVDFDRVFVPVWVALAVVGLIAGLRTKADWSARAPVLNATALFLVLLPGFALARYAGQAEQGAERWRPDDSIVLEPEEPVRDIYYLILDRYGSDPVLRDFFDFDNGEFRKELEERGFYVTETSQANYPQTIHSLASSLNLEYLDDVSPDLRSSGGLSPLLERLEDHRVGAMLRSAGYRYHHAGAWWVHTRHNRNADHVFRTFMATEFTGTLLDRTLPIRGTSAFAGNSGIARRVLEALGYSRLARWRFLNAKFEWIEKRADASGPAFVFGHFLLPHNPYTMDRNGRFVGREEELRRGRRRSYVEQVVAANRKVLRLVDGIMARSAVHPIIIIQADEGPYPDRFYAHQGGATEWRTATTDELRMKLGILNALYLPDRDSLPLHPGISPVNTFRVVFDAYFGTSYGVLPDRSYIFSGDFHDFWDVTEELRAGLAGRDRAPAPAGGRP